MTEAFIGLGSNLDDRIESLSRALDAIGEVEDTAILGVSNVVESRPWGVTDQPLFANAVAHIATAIPADRLLEILQDIETSLGRIRAERNGPRTIDLDILLYGDDEWVTPVLTVPHPRLAERDFAVTPLLELAPDTTWPDGTPVTRDRAKEGRIVGVLGPVPGYEAFTPRRGEAEPAGAMAPSSAASRIRPAQSVQPTGDAGAWAEVASATFNAHGGIALSAQLLFDAAILEQEGIPYEWDPLPPEEEYSPWMLPRVHRLLVPPALAERARELLAAVHAAPLVPEGDESAS